MNKKYILIISVIGIFLISLFLLINNKNDNKNDNKNGQKLDKKITNQYIPLYAKNIENIDKTYYENSNFLTCFDITTKDCFKNHLKKDLKLTGSFLEKINTISSFTGSEVFDNCIGDSVANCYNSSISKKLDNSLDISICENYEEIVLKQNCLNETYPKIAISKDDINICNNLKEVNIFINCQDIFNTNKSVKNKDIFYCDKLSSDFSKKICRDNFYFSVALDIKDINFCKKAINSTDISNCASNYINQTIFSIEIKNRNCEKIKTYSSYLLENELTNLYNRCILEKTNYELSLLDPKKDKEKYIELCQKFIDENMKKDCISKTESKDKSFSGILVPEKINSGSLSEELKKDLGINTNSGSNNSNSGTKTNSGNVSPN